METLRNEARKLVYANVPFRHRGRTLDGMDCVGVMLHLFRACGVDLPDYVSAIQDTCAKRDYVAAGEEVYAGLFEYVPPRDASVGDVVLFADDHLSIQHLAVVTDPENICHIRAGTRVILKRLAPFLRRPEVRVMHYTGPDAERLI